MSFPVILTAAQTDVLREVGNIGAGHAATALAKMLQQTIRMSVPAAEFCAFDGVAAIVGGDESLVAAVILQMSGDIAGNILFLFSLASARRLVGHLLQSTGDASHFTDLERSVLAEVGNILSGAYLNALSSLTNLRVRQSVPAVAIDMAGAVLDASMASSGITADAAMVINASIRYDDEELNGHLFLVPDPNSLITLLEALGCWNG